MTNCKRYGKMLIAMAEIVTSSKVSLCGAVDLLAAIFSEDAERLRRRYGVPTRYNYCLLCGKRIKEGQEVCGRRQCIHQWHNVPLACDVCGKVVYRWKSQVIYHMSKPASLTGKPYQHVFCTRRCQGEWLSKHYGFAINPPKRKYDYALVQQLIGQGKSGKEIAQQLGAPISSIYHITKALGLRFHSSRRKYDYFLIGELLRQSLKSRRLISNLVPP